MSDLPAVNPRKKSLMPAGELRRRLRGVAHGLDPVVQIGKDGVTPGLIKQLVQALAHHELVKVKIGSECPDSRFEVAERLGAEPGVQVVQILGRTVAVYKRHPQKPRYEGGAPTPRAGAKRSAAR
jgi:RNA-binding protein